MFGSGIYWIIIGIMNFTCVSLYKSIFLLLLLVFYLSIYPTMYTYVINRFFFRLHIFRFIFISPALWQIFEYIRGNLIIGFPWLQFGYTQIDGPLKIIAPIFGVEMVTFILVSISGLLTFLIIQKKKFF
ncbi:hypothetical protein AOQ88_00180 [Candidatus Riesia sp. GBBU]|nr:hypothetical protein AOQ88_00180 [Candidatus Riesia sp. GBBU]